MGDTAHQLTDAERSQWLARNTFECPVYRARLSPQQCAANRKRPDLNDGSGFDGHRETLHRKPGCGDDCPTWIAQRDAKPEKPKSGIEACGYCERRNVSSPARGLCGTCNGMAVRGEIVKGADNVWREKAAAAAEPDHIPQKGEMVAPSMMNTDPAAALITTEEAEQLLDSAESSVPASAPADAPAASPPSLSGPVAPLPAAGPGGPAQAGQTKAEADDRWEFYGPRATPLLKYDTPGVTITPSHDLVLNAKAVEHHGLASVTHVRLAWNGARCAVGLVPAAAHEPGALTLQNRKGLRVVSVRHFLRRYGVRPQPKHYIITSGPGGMLVITIELTPAQGKEAA